MRKLSSLGIHLFLIIASVISLFPFVWMLIGMTNSSSDIVKGKFSFGANYLRATYDRFEGHDLKNGDIHLYLTHVDTNADNGHIEPWFEGDVIQSDLSIRLVNETTVVYANYGVTDKFDVGIAIPYLRLQLDADINASIQRLATGVDPFIIHQFTNGTTRNTYTESGKASGIGDVVLRAKYAIAAEESYALAAALDVRLPTGNEDDLLGSGGTQGKLQLIIAGAPKRFAPRASVGYTYSHGGASFVGTLPNEFNYTAGFDLGLHERVTLSADFIGRTMRNTTRLTDVDQTFTSRLRLDPTIRSTTFSTTNLQTGNLNVYLGSAGVKINPFGQVLIIANVLFAIGDSGLQDKITPVVGLDYTF